MSIPDAGGMIICELCVLPICHEAENLPDHAHVEEIEEGTDNAYYHGWCWKVVEGERQDTSGFETPYRDESGTSPSYREAMRDAGRGHLLS